MSEPTLRAGMVRIYRATEAEGDRGVQLATGIDPETGRVLVFLRLGGIIGALTPTAATELADALKVEAAYASVRQAPGPELEPS